MMLLIISSRFRQSRVSQFMLLSITFNQQLCPPPRLPLTEGLFSSHPHFHSPPGVGGVAGGGGLAGRQGSGQFTCAPFISSVVLSGQWFSKCKPKPSISITWELVCKCEVPGPSLDLLNKKLGRRRRAEWNTKTCV